jgi:hypothetical protein
MAATDLSSVTRGAVSWRPRRVTLPSGAGDVREVILPTWVRKVGIYFKTSADADAAGAVAETGTDGSAQVTNASPVPAGYERDITLTPGGGSLFLSGTASGYAYLSLSRG